MQTFVFRQPGWHAKAACLPGNHNHDARVIANNAFSERNDRETAKRFAEAFCQACSVRIDCLMEAVEVGEEHGVWGGILTAKARKKAAAEYAQQ